VKSEPVSGNSKISHHGEKEIAPFAFASFEYFSLSKAMDFNIFIPASFQQPRKAPSNCASITAWEMTSHVFEKAYMLLSSS